MKFTWNSWDIDGQGEAYVIAKKICPQKEDVPQFIVIADKLHEDCKAKMIVEEAWCKWQVRTDWENGDGEPCGGYFIAESNYDGKRGWFPVWIVKGEWY